MTKHTGGKLSKAAKTLAKKGSSKKEKTKAAKVLKKHQDLKH